MSSVYAVAGNPIFQSRSPIMFNAAFRELSLDAAYIRLAAATAEEVATTARAMGLGGINITTPFKADIIPHLDEIDTEARTIGSVNAIVNKDGRLRGLNTDVAGVLGALDQGGFDPEGKSAVVLGAGGAARAAAFALVSAGAHVVIANRTENKARQAAEGLGCHHVPLGEIGKALKKADILISAVSSYDPIVDPRFLHKRLVILDANYSRPTPLVNDATRAGLTVIHGREWLLAQAIPAFELFTEHVTPVPVMNHVLRKTKKDGRSNIALIGFMGSGKSTVAEALGAKTGMTVTDIDKDIQEKAGSSIAEIFSAKGEETFRRMEMEEIDALRLVSNTVVSCGGGAVLRRPNVRVLRNNCLTVWLWTDIETALARIGDDASRPLLNGLDPSRASALLQERLFLYASTCDLLVNAMGKQPDEIAQRIFDETYNTLNR
jgi:shikimate dehydrogenase